MFYFWSQQDYHFSSTVGPQQSVVRKVSIVNQNFKYFLVHNNLNIGFVSQAAVNTTWWPVSVTNSVKNITPCLMGTQVGKEIDHSTLTTLLKLNDVY